MTGDEHRDAALQPELLRAIVDGTTDAVFVKDRDGRYLFCNDAAAKALGRAAEEIVGRTDHEILGATAAAASVAVDQRVLGSGAAETIEDRDDARGTCWLTKKFPYRDRDGQTVGVVGISRDISDRARAEGAVKEREALLRLVIDALPVGVMVLGPQGDIVMRNRMTEQIWGKAIERGSERWQLSRGWWHDTGIALEPHEWASVRALTEGIAVLDQVVTIGAFDGQRRTIRNSAVPIRGASGSVGAVVLNEDITERIRLQSELAQAQKMDAIGRLASGVAHDFNNLLTVILTYAELLLGTFSPGDQRREDLLEVRRAAESATSLTRQLLAFGRREIVQARTVSLEAVVAETQKLLSRVLGEHIRIVTSLATPANNVWMDPLQLEQILLNLAVNARDAMPDGGELRISTRRVEPGLAVLTVTDTGTGMDPRTLARIFEPFFTTKDRGRGTGLGLSTVHGIVEQAGGVTRASSTVGAGTTFEVELPLSRRGDSAAADHASSMAAAGGGTEQVLLVEDSPAVRLAVRAMLAKLGYTAQAVGDAAAALAHFDSGAHVDLLITDVVLIGETGRALADHVSTRWPATRVLFISGYADDETLRAQPRPDDRRILAKPFTLDELARTVREVLGVRK